MNTTTLIPVEAFLASGAYEKCEYIEGRVVEAPVGNKRHSRIQLQCGALLAAHLKDRSGAYCGTELRCRITVGGKTRFYQPDVVVVLNDPDPDSEYLDRAPDLVVEIRSPSNTTAELTRKMEHYFANGARLGWIILPDEQAVLALSPTAPPRTLRSGDRLDAAEILPGFAAPVDDLFS
ncbi:MAG: Uma2 family endonuclease [Bryobacteraceae bacterium]